MATCKGGVSSGSGAIMPETNDEWTVARRNMSLETPSRTRTTIPTSDCPPWHPNQNLGLSKGRHFYTTLRVNIGNQGEAIGRETRAKDVFGHDIKEDAQEQDVPDEVCVNRGPVFGVEKVQNRQVENVIPESRWRFGSCSTRKFEAAPAFVGEGFEHSQKRMSRDFLIRTFGMLLREAAGQSALRDRRAFPCLVSRDHDRP